MYALSLPIGALTLILGMQSAIAEGLIGSVATTAAYCCTAPIEADRISEFVVSTVGPTVEVPNGSLLGIGGYFVIPLAVDFTASTIEITYTADGQLGNSIFNGGLFQFSGAPNIIGISVDSRSSVIPVSYGFTDNSIFINSAGQTVTSGALTILNVTTVPEAGTVATSILGLLTILGITRHQRSKA